MLFNSAVFFKFFAAFLLLYYLVRRHLAARNLLVVAASYVFYGWWDYRFLSLLLFSSLLDYTVGRGLGATEDPRRRRWWIALSLAGNLGLLGFFKYYNFFVDSFVVLLTHLGVNTTARTWNIVLPVGISFYTFQTLSYALDAYRRKLVPTRNLLNFLAYVSFFPQLVAGPIERGTHLLPQFETTRVITAGMLAEGIWLMIWGMFKKVVVADNLAPLVDLVFQHPADSGPMVVLGTLAFGLQIYGDFSGYSDIARGLARVLGFDLRLNFNLPYLAANVREFWRRWHISLSSWLRDYLYISLGGNRGSTARVSLNLLLTMLLGGLWHGAAWNFVLWGAWHGFGLLVHRVWSANRAAAQPPGLNAAALDRQPSRWAWALTMLFVFYGWLLFRAGSLEQVIALTRALGHFGTPAWFGSYVLNLVAFALPLVAVQFWQARTNNLLAPLTLPAWARFTLQGVLLWTILLFWKKQAVPFIYFQF
jgi:D-alanyl-lipoteichoic acid acyltransferase DltB (MBOAT superfamily)